jgi:hypothetical protein
MPVIYDYVATFEKGPKCLGISIGLATLVCLLSTICSFILFPLYKHRKRVLKINSSIELSKRSTEKIKLTDAFYFPSQIWLIISICVTFYSLTFPFISLAKVYFIKKYDESSTIASLQQRFEFIIKIYIHFPLFFYNIIFIYLQVYSFL